MDFRLSMSDVRSRRAFTLIELLVVIGIIGIVIALGVPLFGVLTGSRSQEAGQNLVAAAIGQARTIAVNEGKYAGILFYVDPATERTAMSLVIVADPQSGLEDPDPYDKYKTWIATQQYRGPGYDPTTSAPLYGDRAIGLTSDATGTFRPPVYVSGTTFSALTNYFGNYKPVIKTFRARKNSANTDPPVGTNPPQNGPYPYNNVTQANSKYTRIQGLPTVAASGPGAQSSTAAFANDYWAPDNAAQITPYATGGEQQLLPIGVGVQLIIQPSSRTDTPAFSERYVRTGLIMFDPQGRLTLDPRSIGVTATLSKYLGLTADAAVISAGVGVVLYDGVAFKADATRTDADWLSQNNGANTTARIAAGLANAALNDNQSITTTTNELNEETWLDANTTPLLINRFSGALSEGQ